MLTEAEVLLRGEEASALLADERLMGLMDRLADRITEDWRRTARSAPTLRDELHAQVAALDAIKGLLNRDVEEAAFVRAKAEKRERARG